MIKDLNEAERRGWEVAPHVTVRKGDHVFHGTHKEVLKRVAELERAEALEAERSASQALENDPITKLVRRVRACAREHAYQWGKYRASRDGHAYTRLKALDAANEQLGKLNEVLEKILRQPKEARDANPELQKLKRSFADPSRF